MCLQYSLQAFYEFCTFCVIFVDFLAVAFQYVSDSFVKELMCGIIQGIKAKDIRTANVGVIYTRDYYIFMVRGRSNDEGLYY